MLELEPWSRTIAYEVDADVISRGKLNDIYVPLPRLRGHNGHVSNDRVAEGKMVKIFAAILPAVFDLELQRGVFSRQTRGSSWVSC